MPLRRYANSLEGLYRRYTRRGFVHPDPLEFLYRYEDAADREIVALVASSLAYGRVRQILASVEKVLSRLGERPARFVCDARPETLRRMLGDFRHRFNTGAEVASMLHTAGKLIRRRGSIEGAFAASMHKDDATVLPAIDRFAALFHSDGRVGFLLPKPGSAGASKRVNLMLRWLVRRDAVDFGDWRRVPRDKLLVPLDTHMHAVARSLGATKRRPADGRTAQEVTAAFAILAPSDPVRYDFALTRLGIHPRGDRNEFLLACSREADHG